MIKTMPNHFIKGRCSPKKQSMMRAVKTGRALLNAFVAVTPICLTVKQNKMKAITLLKSAR